MLAVADHPPQHDAWNKRCLNRSIGADVGASGVCSCRRLVQLEGLPPCGVAMGEQPAGQLDSRDRTRPACRPYFTGLLPAPCIHFRSHLPLASRSASALAYEGRPGCSPGLPGIRQRHLLVPWPRRLQLPEPQVITEAVWECPQRGFKNNAARHPLATQRDWQGSHAIGSAAGRSAEAVWWLPRPSAAASRWRSRHSALPPLRHPCRPFPPLPAPPRPALPFAAPTATRARPTAAPTATTRAAARAPAPPPARSPACPAHSPSTATTSAHISSCACKPHPHSRRCASCTKLCIRPETPNPVQVRGQHPLRLGRLRHALRRRCAGTRGRACALCPAGRRRWLHISARIIPVNWFGYPCHPTALPPPASTALPQAPGAVTTWPAAARTPACPASPPAPAAASAATWPASTAAPSARCRLHASLRLSSLRLLHAAQRLPARRCLAAALDCWCLTLDPFPSRRNHLQRGILYTCPHGFVCGGAGPCAKLA